MTFNNDIEKTEKEIAVLQKKLELLKEIETHKSLPKMTFELCGKFESVSYNDEFYIRMDYSFDTLWYKSKNTKNLDGNNLTLITDGETHRLLEGLWFNDVRKGRYNDEVEEPKPQILKDIIREWWGDDETSSTCDELLDKIAGWLPDELEDEEDEMGYNQGWNDCLNEIKKNLR